jgi:cysteinyl-tRNA synthetase
MVVRFYMLQAHYSSPIDFSNSSLQAAEAALRKLLHTAEIVSHLQADTEMDANQDLSQQIYKLCDDCATHMCDDFNTAKLIATLFEMSAIINSFLTTTDSQRVIGSATLQLLTSTFTAYLSNVLGIKEEKNNSEKTAEVMHILMQLRNEAKSIKNFALSDRIRNQLKQIGIVIQDSKMGESTYKIYAE